MVLKKYQVQYPVENPPKVNRTVPYHAVEKRHSRQYLKHFCMRHVFIITVLLCLCAGQRSPQGAEHAAAGGVHVQRAEETGLRRGLPLALSVHRLEALTDSPKPQSVH